tara:strand:- start:1043 stop:1399 length:357 start_codon:yes stop_codon:yes gene_type:complete
MKHFRSTNGFQKSSQGEGVGLLDFCENRAQDLDISLCMICVDHGENTISKEMFLKNKIDGKVGGIHLDILDAIMKKQYPEKMITRTNLSQQTAEIDSSVEMEPQVSQPLPEGSPPVNI